MITVTDKAKHKVNRMLEERGRGIGIRLGVKTTGCSGLAYVLEHIDGTSDGDKIFESNGVDVYINEKSIPYLKGVEMDWVRNGLNEGFDFKNPNERDRCGCGESFRV